MKLRMALDLTEIAERTSRLANAGKREQARWAFLKEFKLAPIETRVDVAWLRGLDPKVTHEVIVEFRASSGVDVVIE
jgi:hypothetical protein